MNRKDNCLWLHGAPLLVALLLVAPILPLHAKETIAVEARSPTSVGTDLADIETIRARVLARERSSALRALARVTPSELDAWFGQLDGSGRWPGIDYADHRGTAWDPNQHLQRLRILAVAVTTQGNSHYNQPASRALAFLALKGWLDAAPSSSNWWHNQIGAPLLLASSLQLLHSDLPADLRTRSLALFPREPSMTGQNRVWLSQLVIHRGLLENNPARIAAGASGIEEILHITAVEGIQCDGSFWQHGAQLYNGGYGLGFLGDSARWAATLRGTSFAFSAHSIDALQSLGSNGTAWMVRNGRIDPLVMGRELARRGVASAKASTLHDALADLAVLRSADSAQPTPSARLAGTIEHGHRHFWRGDYSVLRRSGFMASLRLLSPDRIGTESLNGENLLGFYLPFGTTLVFRDGHEFDDIAPVWDWRRLPGTTTLQAAAVPPITNSYLIGKNRFAGGVSDGINGHAALEQNDPRNPVAARKSWFFFDDGFVALVAGIRPVSDETTPAAGDVPVFTTLNQTYLRTPVRLGLADGTRKDLPVGNYIFQAGREPAWARHDGVGYVFPSDNSAPGLRLEAGPRTGDWHRVNNSLEATPVTRDLFLLAFDHGPLSATSLPLPATHYIVLPDADEDDLAAFVAHSPVAILANTPALQAVRYAAGKAGAGALTGITFFEPGVLTIRPGLTLAADSACIILLREFPDSALTLSVAAPRPNDQGRPRPP
jgi:chondroitin AC lyase